MRMRFKPYAHDELMAADFHVHEPLIWGGRWHAQYARPAQPLSLIHISDGKKECRAWTIRKGTKAPQAAGQIHSDFERGFISQLACAHPENN